jgi:predicted metal-dependent phosphoesterase TrpH
METAVKVGLNAVAITDHDDMRAAFLAEKIARQDNKFKDKLTVIKGVEVSSADGHILALNVNDKIKPGMSAVDTIEAIKSQSGIAIAPHPFAKFGLGNKIKGLKVNAIEVINPYSYFTGANKLAQRAAKEMNFNTVAGSDAHSLSLIGKVYTEVDCESNSVEDIIAAIVRGSTKPKDNMGFGSAALALIRGLGLIIMPDPKIEEDRP